LDWIPPKSEVPDKRSISPVVCRVPIFESGLTNSNLCSSLLGKLCTFEHPEILTVNGSPLRSSTVAKVQMIGPLFDAEKLKPWRVVRQELHSFCQSRPSRLR